MPPNPTSPRVAIFSHEYDLHAHAVRRELKRRFNTECAVFESTRFGGDCGLSWSSDAKVSVIPSSGDGAVDVRDLHVAWLRWLGTFRAITRRLELDDDSCHEFISDNTKAASVGMMLTAFRGRLVDPLGAVEEASNKLVQLQVAQELGFRVPDTLVSANPGEIRRFAETHDGEVIVKAVRMVRRAFSITSKVTRQLLDDDDALGLCPSIYQEYIPGRTHIRVHVFGDRVIAASLDSDDLDWRGNVNVPVREHRLPEPVQLGLKDALKRLGLSMGIFDLKLTDEGEYVWLEVNPQGQFLFIEALSGLPLANTMAEFLYLQLQLSQAPQGIAG